MIVDPFDKTYNPGKTIKILKDTTSLEIIETFKILLKRIVQKGTLGLDINKLN
jgi:hypothetical protein